MKRSTWMVIGAAGLMVGTGIALLVTRVFFFSVFRCPSSSMYPSLPAGSHIWVNRWDKKPAYGEVMVFHFPENPDQDFVKRVVALPGDKVETHGTSFTINGWSVPHCLVGKHTYEDTDVSALHAGTIEVEWLGDETYLVFHDERPFTVDFGPYAVKSGEYFVMGDNRDNSHDSRAWFSGSGGGVPDENTVGRARMGTLVLPRDAESLRGALDACLAKRPSKTRP